jgi:hypothetical protein
MVAIPLVQVKLTFAPLLLVMPHARRRMEHARMGFPANLFQALSMEMKTIGGIPGQLHYRQSQLI